MHKAETLKERGDVKEKYLIDPYYDIHHDPYFVQRKYVEPCFCPGCGVAFHKGSFKWLEHIPNDAEEITCPACLRIKESYAGGEVTLNGNFVSQHKNEIINIIRNVEGKEKDNRPLQRIIAIEEAQSKIVVTTTYEHVARRIAEAVHRACKGELKMHYEKDEKFFRALWERTD